METIPAEPVGLVIGSTVIEKTESGMPQPWVILKRLHNGMLLCNQRDFALWKSNHTKPQTTFIERSELYLFTVSLAALLDLGARNLGDERFKALQDLTWESAIPVPKYDSA